MKRKIWIMLGVVMFGVGAGIGAMRLIRGDEPGEVDSPEFSSEAENPGDADDIDGAGDAGDEPSAEISGTPAVAGSAMANFAAENYTLNYGKLALINPVFTVSSQFIAARRAELVNIAELYGIREGLAGNGAPLLDAEAASHLAELAQAYEEVYPGHKLETRSCFRRYGTNCGRLCYATGTSDHHSGYTCDLIDPQYGTELNTDYYPQHLEWQWLKANAHKYGFIDRFPEEWAGGTMDEPVNITAGGTTGLFETWHYRYVGLEAAAEIAGGKYNDGRYDSLEHYLLRWGLVRNLLDKSV